MCPCEISSGCLQCKEKHPLNEILSKEQESFHSSCLPLSTFGYISAKIREGSLVIVAGALTEDLLEAILIFDLQFM